MSEDLKNKLPVTRRGLLGATASGAVLAATGAGSALLGAKPAQAASGVNLEPGELDE